MRLTDPHPHILPFIDFTEIVRMPDAAPHDQWNTTLYFLPGWYERDEWHATSERVRWAIEELGREGIDTPCNTDPLDTDYQSADEYQDPRTGELERRTARIHGLHPHELVQVYEAITGRTAIRRTA